MRKSAEKLGGFRHLRNYNNIFVEFCLSLLKVAFVLRLVRQPNLIYLSKLALAYSPGVMPNFVLNAVLKYLVSENPESKVTCFIS